MASPKTSRRVRWWRWSKVLAERPRLATWLPPITTAAVATSCSAPAGPAPWPPAPRDAASRCILELGWCAGAGATSHRAGRAWLQQPRNPECPGTEGSTSVPKLLMAPGQVVCLCCPRSRPELGSELGPNPSPLSTQELHLTQPCSSHRGGDAAATPKRASR